MNFNDFQPLALKTESKPERINAAGAVLHSILGVAILSTQMLDQAKKAIFYGKELDGAKFGAAMLGTTKALGFLTAVFEQADQGDKIANFLADRSYQDAVLDTIEGPKEILDAFREMDASKLNVRLLHAGIGKMTEAGEFAEALIKAWFAGVEPDKVNLGEEIADGAWYDAIACDEAGLDFHVLLDTVIAKLKARYGHKFDAEKAENRDLETERAVLEAGIAVQEGA